MPSQPATKPLSGEFETTFNEIALVGRLVDAPELARVYVYVCYYGPVTRPEIQDALDLPKTTVYEYVETLESFGVVAVRGSRPSEVTAEAIRIETDGTIVTPMLLHAIARQTIDDDISHFVERYGVGKLAGAVRQAGLHYAGRISQRMAAEPLDITTGEAMLIVDALRPVIAAGREYDPYFEAVFPDVATEVDIPELDVTAPLPTEE